MEINPVSSPISHVHNNPITQPQAEPQPPESEPEVAPEESSGKAKGVISKLNDGDHFNAVANVRLRIVHFDNEDLEKIDPGLLPHAADVPGNAYEKFLEQYKNLPGVSQAVTEAEEEPEPELPLVPEEEPAAEIPEPETTPIIPEIIPEEPSEPTPPETEPIITVEPIVPQVPVDTDEGIFTAFEEIWDIQVPEDEPETLDIVM